ncbi:ATP-binding protein [Streptomyces sp. NPDC046866]|uniref:ATP-binding protein n=1 Tax=Streptomyces sp. NPDC046866 TaxID=3154921 RepID=UPI003454E751
MDQGPEPASRAPSMLSAAAARELTRDFLTAHGTPPHTELGSLLLVVTELVTNAQRHAGGVTNFHLAASGDGITVTVGDRDPRAPVDASSPAWQPGGFGWPVILKLASQVEVTAAPPGKQITATVPWPADPA